jgi:hypothetical protein
MIAFARRRLDRGLDRPDARALKHRVKRGDELGVTVTDKELDRLGAPVEIHHEVPCLLGNPCRSRISARPDLTMSP